MKLFLILLISLNCFANTSGAEIKTPPSLSFDFTFQSPQNKIQESLQDMIKIEIGKENFLTRRNSNIWDCKRDQFNTAYCPSELNSATVVSSSVPAGIITVSYTYYADKIPAPYYVPRNIVLHSNKTVYDGESYNGGYNTSATQSGTVSHYIDWATYTFWISNGVLYSNKTVYDGESYNGGYNTSATQSGTVSHYINWATYTFWITGSCPSGTTLEGNQCKGYNYVCPTGYVNNGSNCRKIVVYTCNSKYITPILLDGNWQCGVLACDSNLRCGYGYCEQPTTPSSSKYQDVAYNPLRYIADGQCNGDICDYALNAKVSYCESKQCPKGDDIIEKDGKCYKLECPAGTYLSGEKCIKVN